jgi:glycosyltransferase involved in cell wall biosynthesis
MLNDKMPVDKVVTGLRSYHYWDKKKATPPGYNAKPSYQLVKKLRKALLINTNCQKLWYIFSQYFPVMHTKYTCDINMFYPENKKQNDKIVIGWAGSLTNHPGKRGFHEFIKPLTDEFPEVELKVQDSGVKLITDDNEMRNYYNSLDLYFAASRTETGPRPVLEAAACGVPVISTDVGIVPELIENNVDSFIVNRDYDAMKKKLKWILDNKEVLPTMGNMMRTKMENEFNWDNIIYQWTDFFKYGIELHRLKKEGFVK